MNRALLGFGIIGAIWLGALIAFHRSVPDPDYEYRVDAFASAAQAEIVVMGGSAAIGIAPSAMGLDGAAIWNPDEDVFETVAQARLLLARPHRTRLWLLALANPAHALDNGASGSCCAARRHETYRLLRQFGDWSMIGGDWRGYLGSFVPHGEKEWLGPLAELGLARGKPFGRAEGAERFAAMRLTALPDKSSLASDLRAKQAEIAAIAYRAPTLADRVVQELLQLEQEITVDGGTLVVVVPPFHATLSDLMRSEMPKETARFSELLARLRRNGVIASDTVGSKTLAHRSEVFADAIHLNRDGAQRYSRLLAEHLVAKGILEPDVAVK